MMNMWKSIAEIFMGGQQAMAAPEDPTVYQVETAVRRYCGKIIYQDDMMIKLKIAKPKPVKILKTNIERITVVKTEMVRQYYQWRNDHRHSLNLNGNIQAA